MRKPLLIISAIFTALLGICAYFIFHKPECGISLPSDQEYIQLVRGTTNFEGKILEGRWGDIFFSKQFIGYYENACPHYQSSIYIIRSKEFNTGQKILAVLSMQDLPGPVYLDLSREVLKLYQSGAISEKVLIFTFFPYLELKRSRNQWYFWHPEWRAQLKEARALIDDPDFKLAVDQKLDGMTLIEWLAR